MLAKLKASINELTPNDQAALKKYSDNQDGTIEEAVIDRFNEILEMAYLGIKNGDFDEIEVSKLFSDELQERVRSILSSRLKLFRDFSALRDMEKEKRIRAEYLVDSIWEQFVVRYSPEFEIDDIDGVSSDAISSLMDALDFISEMCVIRGYSYKAIVSEVKEQTDVSAEMSDYIARKINKDFEKLQLNYIVRSIRLVERNARNAKEA